MNHRNLNQQIGDFADKMPIDGMAASNNWTNKEVKRILERISVSLPVSNSEYTVAMGVFWGAQQ